MRTSCKTPGLIFFLMAISLLFVVGCASPATLSIEDREDSIVYIGERFFATQFMDIMNSSGQYLGRTIQYEGIFWITY